MEEELKTLFLRILEENKLRILRIARVYAHDREDQKDLYQDVIMNIWKSLPSVKDPSLINTWVYRVCLNVCMQYSISFRKKNRGRTDLEGIIIMDNDNDIQGDFEKRENIKKINECIAHLHETEKSIILLFLEDMPYKSISDITGLSENLVAVRLGRIRKKIINCINQ